jgi:HSP20 family protein
MKPVNYNPSPTNALGSMIDNFFNSNLNSFMGSDFFAHSPSLNVIEKEKSFLLEMAAPGLKKEDISINLEGDYLSISSEVKEEKEQKEGTKFLRKEFNYSSFKRQMKLPENINVEAISAKYENGVLFVEIPKVEAENTQLIKTINIQ